MLPATADGHLEGMAALSPLLVQPDVKAWRPHGDSNPGADLSMPVRKAKAAGPSGLGKG